MELRLTDSVYEPMQRAVLSGDIVVADTLKMEMLQHQYLRFNEPSSRGAGLAGRQKGLADLSDQGAFP